MAGGGKKLDAEKIAADLVEQSSAVERQVRRAVKSVIVDQNYAATKQLIAESLNQLQTSISQTVPVLIRQAFDDGDELAAKFLADLKTVTPETLLAPLSDVEAVLSVVTDLNMAVANSINTARSQTFRTIDLVARRETLRAVTRTITGRSDSLKVRVEQANNILNAEGISNFVDRRGRRWALTDYLEMRLATDTRKAVTEGAVMRYTTAGIQYVQVSRHADACPVCQQYEGEIARLDGGYDQYTTGGYVEPPFHPRCRHVLAPYQPSLSPLFEV